MRGKAHLIPRLDSRQPDSDLHYSAAGYGYGTLTSSAAYPVHLQEQLDVANQAVANAGYQQYLPNSSELLRQPEILGYSGDSVPGIGRQDPAAYSHGQFLAQRQQLDLSAPSSAGMTPYPPDGYSPSGLPHASIPGTSLPMMGGLMQQPRLPSGIPSRKPKTESKPMIDPVDNKQLCTFFMRTGTCAYGDRCRYKHPKDRPPPQLNSRGFPLREGEPDCEHYIKRGWCAFGVTCKFNHPESTAFMHMPYQQPSFVPMPGLVTMPYMPYSYPAYSSTGIPAPSVYPPGSYSPQSPMMSMSPMGMPRHDAGVSHGGESGTQSAADKAAHSLEALTLRGQPSK